MTRDEVIAKIRKLLRLKHGGTPDEIAKALDLARKLAEQHGIELDTVNADLDADRYTVKHSEVKNYGRSVPQEVHRACNLVKRYFDVDFISVAAWDQSAYRAKYTLNVIGQDIERLFAAHLVIFISRAMNHAWKTKRGRCRNRTAFLIGFVIGIESELAKLRPPRPTSEALAVSFRSYMALHWPRSTKSNLPSADALAARMSGYVAGKGTNVSRVVDGNESPALVTGNLLPA